MGLGYLQALKPELQQTREAPAHPAQHHWFSQGSVGLGSACRAGIHLCPPSPPMGVSKHGQELPGQGQTLQVRIGRRGLMLKMLGLSTSNLLLNFGQVSLPWCSTPSMVTHINLALLLPQKAARAPQHQDCRSSVPRPCSRWSRSCARKGDVPRTAGNPQAAPVTAQNAQNSTSEACNTTRSLGEGAASCSRRQTPPAAPWGHRAQRGPPGNRSPRGPAEPGGVPERPAPTLGASKAAAWVCFKHCCVCNHFLLSLRLLDSLSIMSNKSREKHV